MDIVIEDNPTRRKILELLKKSGGMTADQLSKSLNITTMGIRQHLTALEKKGLITNTPKRHGIGRPKFEYRLTDRADALFPKQYDSFALRLLQIIEDREGREKVNMIFQWLKDSFIQTFHLTIPRSAHLDEKVKRLVELLNGNGYLSELLEDRDHYYIRNFNCPISAVAQRYRESCNMELQMYRGLLGVDVKRTECQANGDISCTYSIKKT